MMDSNTKGNVKTITSWYATEEQRDISEFILVRRGGKIIDKGEDKSTTFMPYYLIYEEKTDGQAAMA